MGEGSERSRLGSLLGSDLVGLGLSEGSSSDSAGGGGVGEGSSSIVTGFGGSFLAFFLPCSDLV